MALVGTLVWLCSLAVFCSGSPSSESVPVNCTSGAHRWTGLAADLKEFTDCGAETVTTWSNQQRAELLGHMSKLSGILRKSMQECLPSEPNRCPRPVVPENGGLACVVIADKYYCKPLCDDGYDFAFLRNTKLYEECSNETRHRWTTQYVGGNRLAVCNKTPLKVAGAPTAYFPEGKDCLETVSDKTLHDKIFGQFKTELAEKDVEGEPEYACLMCG